jgi:hypothetical protein
MMYCHLMALQVALPRRKVDQMGNSDIGQPRHVTTREWRLQLALPLRLENFSGSLLMSKASSSQSVAASGLGGTLLAKQFPMQVTSRLLVEELSRVNWLRCCSARKNCRPGGRPVQHAQQGASMHA